MRDLEFNDKPRAVLARKVFVNRVVRYIGSYIAEMGGADAIVFTAGVGEKDTGVRKAVMDAFKYMGIVPDYEANKGKGRRFITKPESKMQVMVVPTDEELMIAQDVMRLTVDKVLA